MSKHFSVFNFQPSNISNHPDDLHFSLTSSAQNFSCFSDDVLMRGCDVTRRRNEYSKLQQGKLHDIGVLTINDAIVLGRGLIATQSGTIIGGGSFAGPIQQYNTRVFSAPLTRNNQAFTLNSNNLTIRKLRGKYILGICPGYLIYGHIIVDLLPRIMLAANQCEAETPILVPKRLPKYVLPMLEKMNIEPERLIAFDESKEILHADQLIAATHVRRASSWWPGSVDLLNNLILGKRIGNPSLPQKLYIDRKSARSQARRLLERDTLEKKVIQHGFTTIAPEKISFFEQLELFSNATHIIGEAGSGLHNSIFGRKNLRTGIIQSSDLVSLLQASLCSAKQQKASFLFGQSLSFTPNSAVGDFVISHEELDNFLAELVCN